MMSHLASQLKSMVHGMRSGLTSVPDEGLPVDGPAITRQKHAPEDTQIPEWSAVATVAVEVWRLGQRIRRLPNHDAPYYQALRNSFERLNIALGEMAVSVEDPVGTDYDTRSSLNVVHVDLEPEVDPVTASLVVTETVSPVVRQDGHVIRHGRVIVGRRQISPETKALSQEAPTADANDRAGDSDVAEGKRS